MKEAIRDMGKQSMAHFVPPDSFWCKPWIIDDLAVEMKSAQILLYNHGQPEERSTIDSLSNKLLEKIFDERKVSFGLQIT